MIRDYTYPPPTRVQNPEEWKQEQERARLFSAIRGRLPAAQDALKRIGRMQPDVIAGLCLVIYAQVIPEATEAQDTALLAEFRKLARDLTKEQRTRVTLFLETLGE